ncbi:glycosyltransferase [Mucilaginibacter lutimaris]|uniref:Glycosyltransferase n=1 Tax=Mucilaginibacter lutimaris TaxID=931629 RepID=A0ABW2ZL40_9SPHI
MKILAVASKGGHWVQLLRLIPAFSGHEVIYISTNQDLAETVKGAEFYCVDDGNRDSKLSLLGTFFQLIKLIRKIKPSVIITTGAAPGLMAIIAGKFLGAKTIWVDSIANVDKVSMSGSIASRFANRVYTQWPHLANSKFMFDGNILS